MRTVKGTLIGVGLGVCLLAAPALAQFDLSGGQRASDGTVYQVIMLPTGSLVAGVDQMKVTSVAGSVNSVQGCSGGGTTLTAVGGVDPASSQVLHDYNSTLRTGVLSPNNLNISFDPTGSGRLTIGTTTAFDICRESANCSTPATDAVIYGLSSSSGSIPTACVASGVTATCSGTTQWTTLAFGKTMSATAPFCASGATGQPTVSVSQCAPAPADGFALNQGQVVVFIYNHSLGSQGFSNGAAGFGIDTDNSGGVCLTFAGGVVSSDLKTPSAPPPLAPSGSPQPPPVKAPALSWAALAVTGAGLLLLGGRRMRRRG